MKITYKKFWTNGNDKAWTKEELEQAIVDAKIDAVGGIVVEENHTKSFSEETNQWTFIGNGNVTNEFKYNGQITLEHSFIDVSNLANDVTVYKDSNGETYQTNKTNFRDIDATTIIKLGFDINGQTITNFKGDKVPNVLPKEITNLSNMFENNQNEKIEGISSWDTSGVTNMDSMFDSAKSFNQYIGDWDTSNVTNMKYMFNTAESFNQYIGDWDTTNVESMLMMFRNATNFNQDISTKDIVNKNGKNYKAWDIQNVKDMGRMFQNAIKFNEDIGNWQTLEAKNMSSMFWDAKSFVQNISSWSVKNVSTYDHFSNNLNWDKVYQPNFM